MEIYRVRPGDSLWAIGRRYNVPIQSIIEINGLTQPENLVIGMELVIPVETLQLYTVQRGDSLWAIGQRFGVSFMEIARVNNLAPPYTLLVGQTLQIPIIAVRHTVMPGDTLWAISQRYGITVPQLIALNNLQPPQIIYPGQVLIVHRQQQRPVIETLGYYNPARIADKTLIIDVLGPYLTYLGIFEYPVTATGEVIGTMDMDILRASREKGVTVLPVLTNLERGQFSSELARTVLSNPTNLNNLINNISAFLQRFNLRGIIIDFENLYPEDRNLFTNFIRLLSERLRRNNQLLVVNLAPKWEDWADRPWAGFFDYKALAPHMDIAAIMTYEWGWREGPPLATAPIRNITRVLDYAIANDIPASKIQMGVTLYGYDWEVPYTPGNLARTVTLPQVWDRARQFRASIQFNEEVKQPTLEYVDAAGKNRKVWFEDALSHYYKYQLALAYGLRGIFYWIINQPFPATWYMISRLFQIRKL